MSKSLSRFWQVVGTTIFVMLTLAVSMNKSFGGNLDDGAKNKPSYLTPCFEVKVENDVKYAEAEGYWSSYPDEGEPFGQVYIGRVAQLVSTDSLDLTMDIYQPDTDSEQLRPLILFIHGGSFFNGDKAEESYRLWCTHFASLGYVAVSMNYRMGWTPNRTSIDAAGFRATQDANAALRFLLHHADLYRINPDWVFVGGTSAGAITALNLAFLTDDNKPASVVEEGPIAKLLPECSETFHIAAVINMWGAVCDTVILHDSQTSVISFHGDCDKIIPYSHGYPFVKMLDKKNDKPAESFLASVLPLVTPSPDAEIWENLVPPMYGSYCIDQYCKKHGIRSELHTGAGVGHSMHVDEHTHQLNSYFYTIQEAITRFLHDEIVKRPIGTKKTTIQ